MLEKVNLTCTNLKNQNPTYYCTTKSWKKSIMHVCKDRKKIKSSSFFFMDLENYLLRNKAKTYRLSPNDYINLFSY
jgi:hypothetical protein